jgi:5'-nucleotidase
MKRIFTLLFVSMIAFAVSAQDLTILHLNDTHSHIEPEKSGANKGFGGVIEQAAYIDSVRCADGKGNVLLLHAGDFSQGSSYFTELNGNLEIDILNAMKFDAVCLGNHEFDNGFEEIARRLRNLEVPVVCANYDFTGCALEDLVQPYVVLKKAGKRIGVIGLLTDVSTVVERKVADKLKYLNPIEAANRYAEYLKNEKKCDLVICLSHLGYDGEPYTDVELAAQTSNVDVIVGGHSHTKLKDKVLVKNLEGDDVVIVQDGKWGLKVGRLDIDF